MKYIRPPATLLEVGSATGSFVNEARLAGFTVEAIDLSSAFADYVKSTHKIEVYVGAIEDFELSPSRYDVVCNWGGISCWNNPLKGISNINQSLKPNGIFAFNHSDIDGIYAKLAGGAYFEFNHASLSLFSSKSMGKMLERSNFNTIYCNKEWQYASLGRIFTYMKNDRIMKVLRALKLTKLTMPVLAFGTTIRICKRV